jgi:hypothetical protein
MNFGVYWHHHFLDGVLFLSFLRSPVINGLVLGALGGITGYIIEKFVLKRRIVS